MDSFQEFHERGERAMMVEEIANLRDQVIPRSCLRDVSSINQRRYMCLESEHIFFSYFMVLRTDYRVLTPFGWTAVGDD